MSELPDQLRHDAELLRSDGIGGGITDGIVKAADLIDAIDALHRRSLNPKLCAACSEPWPCPTHLLIHPEDKP